MKEDIRTFEVDFDKIKNIDDIRVIFKMLIVGWNFDFNDPEQVYSYNQLKHLLKEKI